LCRQFRYTYTDHTLFTERTQLVRTFPLLYCTFVLPSRTLISSLHHAATDVWTHWKWWECARTDKFLSPSSCSAKSWADRIPKEQNCDVLVNQIQFVFYKVHTVVEMAQDKWWDALLFRFPDIIIIFFTPCEPIIFLFFFIFHIKYIILVRGYKYAYNTNCETAYTKQHDKPGTRAWMLKTIIFTEEKIVLYINIKMISISF
jgi:hypothetical protein